MRRSPRHASEPTSHPASHLICAADTQRERSIHQVAGLRLRHTRRHPQLARHPHPICLLGALSLRVTLVALDACMPVHFRREQTDKQTDKTFAPIAAAIACARFPVRCFTSKGRNNNLSLPSLPAMSIPWAVSDSNMGITFHLFRHDQH